MRYSHTFVPVYFLLIPSLCVADVSATLNEDFFFVLNGSGEQMVGLQINSPENGLIPAESNSAEPFMFLLENSPGRIVYANVGQPYILDGSVAFTAGWDPVVNDHGVTMEWGTNVGTIQPVDVLLGPCDDNCPPIRVSVNEDNRIVLRGFGQKLSEITFRSASQSLVPTGSPAPFAQLPVNTASEVQLDSPGSQVTIDGSLTLGVGWSDHVFTRDIEYQYQEFEGDSIGPIPIDIGRYENKTPRFPQIDVFVNEDDHFVVRGDSQPITNLKLLSSSGSLIPSNELGPFSSYASNTAEEVSILTSDALVLDGEIVLPTKWDWHKPKEVTAEFELLGEIVDQRFFIPTRKYPTVPEQGKEPLLITLDENDNFVITGIGQEILGVEFTSASGALRVGTEETAAPFPARLSNTPENVTLGVLGGVLVDGSFVMDFGPVSPDRLDEIDVKVGFGGARGPIFNPANVDCSRCDFPEVSVSEDGGFVLSSFPELVTELTFTSSHGGLQGFALIPDGVALLSASDTEVTVGNEAGFDAEIMDGLQVLWGANFDSEVFVSFTFLDGTSFGPLPVASARAVPEPSGMLLGLGALCALLRFRERHGIGAPTLNRVSRFVQNAPNWLSRTR